MDFDWEAIIGALFLLFVAAVVVESSLSLLFEWRLWTTYFDSKGLKTPVSFAMAYILCRTVDFDVMGWLFASDASLIGYIATAMTVAGGSKKVLNMFGSIKQLGEQVRGGNGAGK